MITVQKLERMAADLAQLGENRVEQDSKDFADKLYALIYLQPEVFNLEKLDPDNRSDFLLTMYALFAKIPDYFRCEKGSLLQYIQVVLKRNYKSWLRQKIKKIATEKSVFNYLAQDYSESLCADFEGTYGERDFSQFQTLLCEQGLRKLLNADKLLIFAFKSSYFLDEPLIKKLALFTGHSEESLWKIKDRIDTANARRIAVYERNKQGLNACYILKNRYLLELEQVNPLSMHYRKIYYAYCLQRGLWIRKTSLKAYAKPSVSNRLLAAIFKIGKHKVDSTVLYARRKQQEKQVIE